MITLGSKCAMAEFYQCTLPQAEEFRVGINLENGKAGFFDNDSTSIMTYQSSRPSVNNLETEVKIFQGKDKGGSGDLRLEFNMVSKRIKLSTIETDGTQELLGYAKCAPSEAWDLSEDN